MSDDAGDGGAESGSGWALVALDPWSLAVGGLVGLAGVLFLLEPVVDPLVVDRVRLRPVVLSAVVFAVALWVGGVVFLVRGRRAVGIGHAGSALGWILVVVATATGSGPVLLAGGAVIAGTALFLASQATDR